MSGNILVRYLRFVHPLGAALTVCGVLIAISVLLILAFFSYMKGEPSMADMVREARAVQSGAMKPDRSGSVASAKHMMYVTRSTNGAMTVLWPYNLAHDDNYFEGYLFEERPLTADKATAFGPFRGGHSNTSQPVPTHLRVDRKISEHWYHVQGEMYK